MIHESGYSVKANFRTFNLSPATKAYSQILLCNPGIEGAGTGVKAVLSAERPSAQAVIANISVFQNAGFGHRDKLIQGAEIGEFEVDCG